jgi:hypothetical protein
MTEAELRQGFQTLIDGFEAILVTLHTMALDIELGSFNPKKAEKMIRQGSDALAAADTLIKAYLSVQPSDPELQELFTQVLVSVRPQLLAGIDAIMEALRKPGRRVCLAEFEERENEIREESVIGSLVADQNRLNRVLAAKSTKGELESSSSDVEEEEEQRMEVLNTEELASADGAGEEPAHEPPSGIGQ